MKIKFLLEADILTWQESKNLSMMLIENQGLFCSNAAEMIVFARLIGRTINWGKVEEKIWKATFFNGCEAFVWTRPTLCESGISHALTQLTKRKVFIRVSKRKVIGWEMHVRINALGMSKVMLEHWKCIARMTANVTNGMTQLNALVQKLEKVWKERGWKEMSLKLPKAGDQSMRQMVELTQERLADKNDIGAEYLPGFVRLTCQSLKMHYVEKWIAKTRGMGRNYLKECKRNEIDPEEELKEAIERWSRYRSGCLKYEDGGEVVLRSYFNFEQFYAYRRDIRDWLANDREQGQRFNIVHEGGFDE